MNVRFFFVALAFMMPLSLNTGAQTPPTLWPVADMLRSKEFVDLTHAFHPGIPHWPGFDNEVRVTTYHYDEGVGTKGHGFLAHQYTIPGQWGTHVDPPAHFVRGKRFLGSSDKCVRGQV